MPLTDLMKILLLPDSLFFSISENKRVSQACVFKNVVELSIFSVCGKER